jgi:O-succinylbenzoate synthase
MKFIHKSCPLFTNLKVGTKTLKSREWIEIHTNGKIVDLAPLPGLHLESLEEALHDFKSGNFKTPSALFAKEVLEIEIDEKSTPKINRLDFIDLDADPLSYYHKWNDNEVVKLKIARNDLKAEEKWLKSLLQSNHKNISFRLDANRSLSIEEFNKLIQNIPLESIQYFEEPLQDIHKYNDISIDNISIALDENISYRSSINLAKFLVIKPTFNLSVKDTLIELKENQFSIIISSAFDPPNNMKHLEQLASKTPLACGLDTLKYFDLEHTTSSLL